MLFFYLIGSNLFLLWLKNNQISARHSGNCFTHKQIIECFSVDSGQCEVDYGRRSGSFLYEWLHSSVFPYLIDELNTQKSLVKCEFVTRLLGSKDCSEECGLSESSFISLVYFSVHLASLSFLVSLVGSIGKSLEECLVELGNFKIRKPRPWAVT